jgi:ribosomal protein S18 acetylase RimI-like enzyme
MHTEFDDRFYFEINKGSKEDIEEIIDLWSQTINWHAEFDKDFIFDSEGKANFKFVLETAINDITQAVYVAKSGKKIIGFLYGYIRTFTGFFRKRIIAHISDITIQDEFRRKGIGTELMKKFEYEFARSNNANCMSLNVHVKNSSGLRFYDNLGFTKNLLSMKKDL